jgi:hypothetical protein
MSGNSNPGAENLSVQQLDQVFLSVVLRMNAVIVSETSKSVEKILNLSMNFLSEKGQNALQEFYNLYFATNNIEKQKNDVNKEVDDLFDAIQAELETTGDVSNVNLDSIEEDEEKKKNRLAIAAIQKQLESIITLETGLREKLVPAMMSMQFEDLVRQRISRIDTMWKTVFSLLNSGKPGQIESLKEPGKELFAGTLDERKLYCPIVLGQEVEDKETNNDTSDSFWLRAS